MMHNSYRFLLVILFAMLSCMAMAQVPHLISYQAVVRYPNNQLVSNSEVSVRISILKADGTVVFSEEHHPTTNANGLFNIVIGSGTAVSGSIANVDWSAGNYRLRNEVDYDGGSDYQIATEGQMLSVPYAFYAKQAESVPGLLDSIALVGREAEALHVRDSLAIEALRSEMVAANNGINREFLTMSARLSNIVGDEYASIDHLAVELRREDSISADSLNRAILSNTMRLNREMLDLATRINNIQTTNGSGVAEAEARLRREDSISADSLNRAILNHTAQVNRDVLGLSNRINTIQTSNNSGVAEAEARLRREDSISADSLNRAIRANTAQVNRDVMNLSTRLNNMQTTNNAAVAEAEARLRREDSVSADSLNRAILNHTAQVNRDVLGLSNRINTIQTSNNTGIADAEARLRREDSISADSLNRAIQSNAAQVSRDVMNLSTRLNNMQTTSNTAIADAEARLRREDSVSADSLNRAILNHTAQVNQEVLGLSTRLNNMQTTSNTAIADAEARLRREDSVSADSLNRAILNHTAQVNQEVLGLSTRLNNMQTTSNTAIAEAEARLRREDSVSADSLNRAILNTASQMNSQVLNLATRLNNVQTANNTAITDAETRLRREDSISADSLNRKIGINTANVTALVNNLNSVSNNRTDSIAQVLRQEDAASADSLNRKIGTNAANITALDSRVNNLNAANNNRTDSIAQVLRQEDAASADSLNRKIGTNAANITALDSRVNNLNAANNNRTDSIAQVLRQEDATSADSLNRKIGTNAANITALDSRVNNLNASSNHRTDSIAQVLRQEDAASADSLNRKIGTNAANITALDTRIGNLRTNENNRMDSLATVLRQEGGTSADSLNRKIGANAANITALDTRISNLRTNENNRMDSLATVLRQEGGTSADSLNRKIGANAANITALDNRISNLRTNEDSRMDSLVTVLRQEDATSADSLNRKFGNYLLAADETKTLAQVLVQGNDADNHRINNLAKGQSLTDAANLQNISDTATALRIEIDTRIANRSSHNLSDVLAAGNNGGARQIKNLADPTENQDAATLKVLSDSIDTLRHYINRMVRQLEYTMRCATLSTTSSVDVMSCDSLVWTVGGENAGTYRESGTFIHRFSGVNAAGCDSTIVMNLTVNRSSSCIYSIAAPSGYTWIDGVTYYDDNNTAVHTLVNVNASGCDSVVRLRYTVLEGVIPAVFTVSSDNRKIEFSKGNLQYQASTNTWRFAENQYTIIRNGDGNTRPGASQTKWADLFGWGTSGWDNGNEGNVYQPWSNGGDDSTYNNGAISLTGENAHADWGVHNPISNGGNQAGLWRTPTSAEWKYILTERRASTVNGVPNARFTHAKIDGVAGLILFADNYVHPDGVAQPRGIDTLANSAGNTYHNNNYTVSEWQAMERAGAIFLPAAGSRKKNEQGIGSYNSSDGRYWASTYAECNPSSYADVVATTNNNTNAGGERFSWLAGYVYFGNAVGVQVVDRPRHRSVSVRLIYDVD